MRYSVTWINISREEIPASCRKSPLHDQATVTRLLEEFPDVFAELPKGLPKSLPTDHPIVVDETQTIFAHRLYRMPAADHEEIKRQVEELVAAGRIRPSTSPFGASAMLRYKKDKSRRMVIDSR